MKNNISLSFCIPTYNNAKSVCRLVREILESTIPNIEVVVLNNGSTDNTLSLLNEITDNRLSIYSNEVNKGALYNMINVLDKGKGNYLIYSTDHDHIKSQKIATFLDFLESNPLTAFGYCNYDGLYDKLFCTYSKGFEALRTLAYITRHPTGFFFKRQYLKEIDSVNRFSDYNYVDLFPLEFVFAELSLKGNGVIYNDPIFAPERGKRVVEHKSATTKGNSTTAFFAPECRLKLALSFRKHIHSLTISTKNRNKLILDSFYREINNAVFGYRDILKNEGLCIHYHMEMRQIEKKEMFSIAFVFVKNYLRKVQELEATNRFFMFSFLVLNRPKSFIGFICRVLLK